MQPKTGWDFWGNSIRLLIHIKFIMSKNLGCFLCELLRRLYSYTCGIDFKITVIYNKFCLGFDAVACQGSFEFQMSTSGICYLWQLSDTCKSDKHTSNSSTTGIHWLSYALVQIKYL